MKKLSTKQATLKHYREMIKFAEKEDPKDYPNHTIMRKAIGQDWSSDYCPYCKEQSKYISYIHSCDNCKLDDRIGSQLEDCCKGLWHEMNHAKTWKTWIKYANLIMEYVKENG